MKILITSKTSQQFCINFKRNVIVYQGTGFASEISNSGKFIGEINQNCFWITKESIVPQRTPKMKFYGEICEKNGVYIKGNFKIDTINAVITTMFSLFMFVILFMTEIPPRNVFNALIEVAFFDLAFIVMIYAFNIRRIYNIVRFLSSL